MRWPLRYQILVPFAGTMLAVVAVVSSLDAALSARRSQQHIEAKLGEVARTLEAGELSADGRGAEANPRPRRSGICPTQQQRPAAQPAERILTPLELAKLPPAGTVQARNLKLEAATSRLDGAVPARGGEPRPHGLATDPRVLHILYPQDDLRLARWQAAYPSLVVGSLAAVVVAGSGHGHCRSDEPADPRAASATGPPECGDFQPLGVPKRNDELSDLVRSANSLGEQLDEMQARRSNVPSDSRCSDN